MRRRNVEIRFEPVAAAEIRDDVVRHHLAQPYLGDFFMSHHQLAGEAARVIIDGSEAGTVAGCEDHLTYVKLDDPWRALGRQALEAYLVGSGIRRAFAASWDLHHVDLVGGFATAIRPQAYQFELLSRAELRAPIDGLSLRLATAEDLPYLSAQDFLDDYDEPLRTRQLRIAERDGAAVGIGVLVPHAVSDDAVDIGMYTEPSVRRRGIGSSILVLLAREALAQRVTAGCWWRNWESRASLERAGLTCVGTIFEMDLDAHRFRA